MVKCLSTPEVLDPIHLNRIWLSPMFCRSWCVSSKSFISFCMLYFPCYWDLTSFERSVVSQLIVFGGSSPFTHRHCIMLNSCAYMHFPVVLHLQPFDKPGCGCIFSILLAHISNSTCSFSFLSQIEKKDKLALNQQIAKTHDNNLFAFYSP